MTEVLGRKVTGKVRRFEDPLAEQWSGERFIQMLDTLLMFDVVESVKWVQYTPFFNDGEPCVFHVHQSGVRIEGTSEDAGEYGDGYLGEYDMYEYVPGSRDQKVVYEKYEHIYPIFQEFADSLCHFELFLQESFGDHASVIATRDGFEIEFYNHD